MVVKVATLNLMTRPKKTIGLILAGGKSQRFGQDKALFTVPEIGRPNIQVTTNLLQPFVSQIIVAANSTNSTAIRQLLPATVEIIPDQQPYLAAGPLGGLFAATKQISGEQNYILLPTDYPWLTPQILQRLLAVNDSFVQTAEHNHYTLAHFKTSHQEVAAALAQDQRRLQVFIKQRCRPLIFSTSQAFTNLNTWER